VRLSLLHYNSSGEVARVAEALEQILTQHARSP
jgi:selenocysteine lyase/cysteine desulfurase